MNTKDLIKELSETVEYIDPSEFLCNPSWKDVEEGGKRIRNLIHRLKKEQREERKALKVWKAPVKTSPAEGLSCRTCGVQFVCDKKNKFFCEADHKYLWTPKGDKK